MATSQTIAARLEMLLAPKVKPLRILFYAARIRGWPFVMAWIQRLTGLLLVVYVCFHMLTLSTLRTPALFDARMTVFGLLPFVVLEWLLALPVVLHAFNGGRLILYELYGNRRDDRLIGWALGLSAAFVLFSGLMMILGNQTVTPLFFWLPALIAGGIAASQVARRTWKTGNSTAWKLQRISGAFMLVMIPGHLLFMHLDPALGHQADVIITRMQHTLIKIVDLALVLSVFYHGAYGVLSVADDYLPSRGFRIGARILVILVMCAFAGAGVGLLLTV